MSELFNELHTFNDVREHVRQAYASAGTPGQRSKKWGRVLTGPLTLSVAEPGPLMAHTVRIAGEAGLTTRELSEIFNMLGKERLTRGIATMRISDHIEERYEPRPNRAGQLQDQIVFYWNQSGADDGA